MKTKEEIIKKVNELFGDKYDCSLVKDAKSTEKITLICKKHGEFSVRYDHLIEGQGCAKCQREELLDNRWKSFVAHAREVHGDKYEYIRDENFVGVTSRIRIVCPQHGEFVQAGINHVNAGQGCAKCYHEAQRGKYNITTEEFIKRAKEVHGDKYDYSQTKYMGMKEKLKIICPIHGVFWQIAYDHLRGFGCEQCKYDKNRLKKDDFLRRVKEIHGDKYSYDKVNYINNHTKIIVTCKEHGDFYTQPAWMLMGMGCPDCNTFRLEEEVKNCLTNEKLNFVHIAKNDTLPWLGKQSLDFYIPDKHIGIECQGAQHFRPINLFGGEKTFLEQKERDERKRLLCEKNGVQLLYFTHEKEPLYPCCHNLDELLEKIRATV